MKVVTISSWLNFGRPAPPGRGSAVGWKFLAPPVRSVCVASECLFYFDLICAKGYNCIILGSSCKVFVNVLTCKDVLVTTNWMFFEFLLLFLANSQHRNNDNLYLWWLVLKVQLFFAVLPEIMKGWGNVVRISGKSKSDKFVETAIVKLKVKKKNFLNKMILKYSIVHFLVI